MRADEKYAEVGGKANAPKCECHDYPMRWNRDTRYTANGRWRCFISQREEGVAAYWRDPEAGRERHRAWYWRDPIGQARRKEDWRRRNRISRMELELRELLNAS